MGGDWDWRGLADWGGGRAGEGRGGDGGRAGKEGRGGGGAGGRVGEEGGWGLAGGWGLGAGGWGLGAGLGLGLGAGLTAAGWLLHGWLAAGVMAINFRSKRFGQNFRSKLTGTQTLNNFYKPYKPLTNFYKPLRLGSTICYGQKFTRRSHQDWAVRFVTAKSWPERATKTRQYDSLRPNVGQKNHQDSAVRFVTAKSWPKGATKTRQYDLLWPNVGQKAPPRLGSTICYGQELARRSHQDSAVRFVTAKRGPEQVTKTRQYDLFTAKSWPEGATKTLQYDLLRPKIDQKEPPRQGSTICYGQELARKSHQDSAVRFVTAERGPERATKTRQYDLLRPNVGQKEPPRLGSTVCYGQELARKSHQDSAVRFVTAKSWPESATKTRRSGAGRGRAGGGRRERGAAGGRQRGGRKVERAAEIETRTRATGDQATTAQKHARVGEKFEMKQPAPERLKRRRVQGSSNQYPKG